MDAVSGYFDLNDFLDHYFRGVIYADSSTYKHWQDAEAISLVSGNALAHLYLKKNRHWIERVTSDDTNLQLVVQALLDRPEVDLIMSRNATGGIVVQSRRGRAVVHEQDGLRYKRETATDPFGYESLPDQLSSEQALRLTADSHYPDGIRQALQVMSSFRSGDLVISASPGVIFDQPRQVQAEMISTGSIHRHHMMVPWASNVSFKRNSVVRTVDLIPTIMSHVGLPSDAAFDGLVV